MSDVQTAARGAAPDFAPGGPLGRPAKIERRSDEEAFSLLASHDVPLSRRDSVRRRGLALADVLGIVLAYAIVWLIDPPSQPLEDKVYLLGALPMWVILNKILGLYDRDANLIHKSTLDEIPRLMHSVALGAALIYLFGPLLPGLEIGRAQTIVFAFAAVATLPVLRGVARSAVRHAYRPERCVIVGSGSVAGLVARKLSVHPEYGIDLVGFVDVPAAEHDFDHGELPLLGHMDQFDHICREFEIERVIVAFSSVSHEHLLDAIRSGKRYNLKITVVPRLFEVIGHGVEIDQVEGMTLLGLRGLNRTHSSLLLKRGIDVVGAALLLLLLAPLLGLLALAVRLDSSGPIFFVQRRIGRGNASFPMIKFRTMVDGADHLKAELEHLNEADGVMFKIADDPRITRVGRFLRRFSLDELPQLWNVLRGDMSLVGPRPLIPSENDHVIGWHRARLELTPGLTGPWQVMGRTAIPFHEMVKIDYLYVAEWSLWNDIKLLIRTLSVVVRATGR